MPGVVRTHRATMNLIRPFGISQGTRSQMDVVITNIDGGWGEAAPVRYYGQSVQAVEESIAAVNALDIGDLDSIEAVMEQVRSVAGSNPCACTAIDIALHDRLAKSLGIPLHRLLGHGAGHTMMTSYTIGIDTTETMLCKIDEARQYSILKIKLGRDFQQDLQIMPEIRRMVGNKTLRVDANGGWSLEQAKQIGPMLADLGVEYIEQPLVRFQYDQLRELHRVCPLPIFADEDSAVPEDIPKIAGAIDGINIKLMKCGGICQARRMAALARAYGMQLMIGCMIETSVAITAAAHFGTMCEYLDLDGNLLVTNDPFTGVTCTPEGGMILPSAPGLGVAPRPEYASGFAAN